MEKKDKPPKNTQNPGAAPKHGHHLCSRPLLFVSDRNVFSEKQAFSKPHILCFTVEGNYASVNVNWREVYLFLCDSGQLCFYDIEWNYCFYACFMYFLFC